MKKQTKGKLRFKGDKTELILHEKNMYRALAVTALPLMLSNFIIALLDIADTFFVGQMNNASAAQAGIGIAWPVINIMLAFNNGLSAAGIAVISRMFGEENKKKAAHYGGLLLMTACAMGVTINIMLFAAAPALMRFMGAEEDVLREAVVYLKISSFEMLPLFLFSAFCAMRQAMGDMMLPVIFSLIAAVVNIMLIALLVMGFGLGARGAAIASVAGQLSILPLYGKQLIKGCGDESAVRGELHIDKKGFALLFKIAAPSVASQVAGSFGFIILQAIILQAGQEVAAAFSIGNKISNILLAAVMALGTSMSAFVGQNTGAKNVARAEEAYKSSRNMSLILTVAGLVLLFPVRRGIVGVMSTDKETVRAAMEYVVVVLLTLPGLAFYQNYMGVFNGSGNTKLSLYMTFAWVWLFRIPLLLSFNRWTSFGSAGVWYAMALSNIAVSFVGRLLLRKVKYE